MWKQARVVDIHKPRKPPSDPGAYRPISLLSTISKILERLVAKRLSRQAIGGGIIPPEQFGFRKHHSTTAQLTRLTEFIAHGYNIRKHTGLITIDLEKAYDTVWINGLIFKLISFKFPAYLIKFIHSYLSNRSFSVTLSDASSPVKYTAAYLPQGAVLSALLFSIYTADFPLFPHIQTALYADDTAIYSQSWRTDTVSRRLSRAMDRICKYCTRWRLKINIGKTTATIFTKRRPQYPEPLHMRDWRFPGQKQSSTSAFNSRPLLTTVSTLNKRRKK
jgi:hypothetical protein